MVNTTLDSEFEGIYEITETARYLHATLRVPQPYRVQTRKLIRWIRLGLSTPDLVEVPGKQLLIAFEDLVSLRVISFLRAHGYSFTKIREAEAYLRFLTGYPRPFATERLWVEALGASDIYAELGRLLVAASRGGQMAFLDLVHKGLIDIHGMTFDDRRVASSWSPRPGVLLHPRIQFGRPCIAGTRIPTDSIAGMVRAGDSVGFLATSYGVTEEQVDNALAWESELAAA